MSEQRRYRITGALFLTALAIIGLPMLFDGAGMPVNPSPDQDQVIVARLDSAQKSVSASPLSVPNIDVIEQTEAIGALKQEAKELAQQVDEEGFATSTGTKFGEPVLQAPREATQFWAIQVASFGEMDNAIAFRDKLRQGGFEAFTSAYKTDNMTRIRVAVGPFVDNTEAQAVRGVLDANYQVQSRLMEFGH